MKNMVHQKEDIIAITRYLLSNYDSKFEFVTEPVLCIGTQESTGEPLSSSEGHWVEKPVWVMQIKLSSGRLADGRYDESFGQLGFCPTCEGELIKRNNCKPLRRSEKKVIHDKFRTWILGVNDEGCFLETQFLDFASNEDAVVQTFKKQYPDYSVLSVELKVIPADRLMWLIGADKAHHKDLFAVDLFGRIKWADELWWLNFKEESPSFNNRKDYFLFDRRHYWISNVNHLIGTGWIENEGLVPLAFSQLKQPLPALGFDKYGKLACSDIWSL